MKIDATSLSAVGSIQATNRVVSINKKAVYSGSDKDDVNVSDKAQLFQSLLQKAREIPEVRDERIREVTERINKGEFEINAQAIAASILRQE